jgi:hypothetical protein
MSRATTHEAQRAEAYPAEFELLARYNDERARGLLHAPWWTAQMRDAQARYDAWVKAHGDAEARAALYGQRAAFHAGPPGVGRKLESDEDVARDVGWPW